MHVSHPAIPEQSLAPVLACSSAGGTGRDSGDETSDAQPTTTTVDGDTTQSADSAPDPDTTDTSAADTTGTSPDGALVIGPEAVVLAPGASAQFVAHTGDGDAQAVAWSISEPDGGSIDASGLYHAPDASASYT